MQGGEKFSESVLADDQVIADIELCSELAPLHNPPAVQCIRACREIMPDVPHVCVFDTAFHQTMPPRAYMYAIPYEFYEQFGIRKYGAHGTSHRYLVQRAAELLGESPSDLKLITCHLGGGCSVTAVDHGMSVDTSMGFTPLGGIVMGTRSGDIDPSIVTYLVEQELSLIHSWASLSSSSPRAIGAGTVAGIVCPRHLRRSHVPWYAPCPSADAAYIWVPR